MGRKRKQIDEIKLMQLLPTMKTLEEIAEELGTCYSVIYNYMKRKKLKRPTLYRECACGCGEIIECRGANRDKRFFVSVAHYNRHMKELCHILHGGAPRCKLCGAEVSYRRGAECLRPVCFACQKYGYQPDKQAIRWWRMLDEKDRRKDPKCASSYIRQTYCHQDGVECARYNDTIGQGCYTGDCFEAGPRLEELFARPGWEEMAVLRCDLP